MQDFNGDSALVQQQMELLNQDLAANAHSSANQSSKINDGESNGTDVEGVDDRAIHCFLQAGLQSGTLRTELNEKDCIFLVNLIN